MTASLSPAPLIQYTPTRRFSHVEVTGLPHHRITTKGGLKITPLPGSKSRGKQPIGLDDSDDDLSLRSPSRTPQFEVLHKQQPNARGLPSSRFGKTQDYEESFSVKRSEGNVYDLESEDSDEYLDEETIPWSQSQTHKRRRLNGSPSKLVGFVSAFSATRGDNSTGLTPMLARTNLKSRDQYEFGQCVDDIDLSNVVIQPAKGGASGTLCHNCRNGTNYNRKARCQNEEAAPTLRDPAATVRCNKNFCERCLRFWYGMDDDAMEFLVSGKKTSEGGTGTGLGLGLFEGIWLCPWCISLCMCTLCQGKRGGPRTRFRPSSQAKVSEFHQTRRSKLPKIRLNLGTLRSTTHIYLPMASLMILHDCSFFA
jgi:hypothetical protein